MYFLQKIWTGRIKNSKLGKNTIKLSNINNKEEKKIDEKQTENEQLRAMSRVPAQRNASFKQKRERQTKIMSENIRDPHF